MLLMIYRNRDEQKWNDGNCAHLECNGNSNSNGNQYWTTGIVIVIGDDDGWAAISSIWYLFRVLVP